MRFKAPEHVSNVTVSSGPLQVEDGYVNTPDDCPETDNTSLLASGFVREDEPVPAAAKIPPVITPPTAPLTDKS
jgi:hypothetical protein